MTDEKALEVLKSWLQLAYHNADGTDECSAELYEALQTTFKLITRQQAEIKRLQSQVARLKKYDEERDILLHARLIKTAKSEAIKEFAERLREKYSIADVIVTVDATDIDNLVKEMVGGEAIDDKPDTPQEKLSAVEFYDKFCSRCGSQRCEGIGTVWFEGCGYKESLRKESENNG